MAKHPGDSIETDELRRVPVPEPVMKPIASIPESRVPMIGREADVAAIQAALLQDDVAILTLTGPGGVGKTRLAQRVMANIADAFDDGARFISLAPIRSPELAIPAIAQELGLREHGGRTHVDLLLALLREKAMLLVLDNFEQVIAAAPRIGELAGACPKLKVLVTSRERLNLHDERVYQVRPLALPDPAVHPSPDELMQSPAARLFGIRAQAVAPDFRITTDNAAVVDAICRRLDALPLAIELAAAWIPTLSLPELLTRLERRLPVLIKGARDQPERLQTMRQTIAWSYDLLTAEEQAGFRRLSVFVGNFTLEEAAAVVDGSTEIDIADLISALIAKSIVVRQTDTDRSAPQRFTMLETIREFGIEQLAVTGEEDDVRSRHARHFVDVVTALPRTSRWMSAWFRRGDTFNQYIKRSYGNERAALEFLITKGDRELALDMTIALAGYWWIHAHYAEGESWLKRVVELSDDLPPALNAYALWSLSIMIHEQGRIEEAAPLAAQAVALYRESGDESALIMALSNLSNIEISLGLIEQALQTTLEAQERNRPFESYNVGDRFLTQLGRIAVELGDIEGALKYHEEALLSVRASDDSLFGAIAIHFYGRALRAHKELGRAFSVLQESLAGFQRCEFPSGVARNVQSIAEVAADDGQSATAVRLFAAVAVERELIGHPIDPEDRPVYERAIALARRELGDDAFQAAWLEGAATPMDDIVREALALQARTVDLPKPAVDSGLTAREYDVLRCLVEGHSNREIAEMLFISPRTATTHVTHILAKFGVETRAAAATYAVRNGLV